MARLREWKLFSEINNMKLLGFNKSQAARQRRADYATISKYWGMPSETMQSLWNHESTERKSQMNLKKK